MAWVLLFLGGIFLFGRILRRPKAAVICGALMIIAFILNLAIDSLDAARIAFLVLVPILLLIWLRYRQFTRRKNQGNNVLNREKDRSTGKNSRKR